MSCSVIGQHVERGKYWKEIIDSNFIFRCQIGDSLQHGSIDTWSPNMGWVSRKGSPLYQLLSLVSKIRKALINLEVIYHVASSAESLTY